MAVVSLNERKLTFFPYFEMAAFRISSSVYGQLLRSLRYTDEQLTCVTPNTTLDDDTDLKNSVRWSQVTLEKESTHHLVRV